MSQINWNDFSPVDGSGVSPKPAPPVGPVNWDDFSPAPEEPGLAARVKQGASRAFDSARTALTDDPNKIAQIAAEQARTALREAGSRRLRERVIAFVAERIIRFSPLGAPYRDLAPGEVPDHILVLAAGLFALVGRWLDGDDPTPPAQMTQRIVAVFQSFSSRAVTD